jgi:phosphotransferase system HPr-like phosphotransfer protein
MATANQILESSSTPGKPEPGLLVMLASMGTEELAGVLANLSSFHPADDLIIATPDVAAVDAWPQFRIVPITSTAPSWTLTATDFVNAYQLAEENQARAVLILGPNAESLTTPALSTLAQAVMSSSVDMAVPSYHLPANAGLINSSILYPLTRSLFASRIRFPLAVDLGLSVRMAQRLASAARRFTSVNEGSAIVWPVNEASVAGFTISEYEVGPRATPQPTDPDINSLLASVTGSLFADIDAKAAYWQRARPLPPVRTMFPPAATTDGAADISSMLDAFRLAYTNLREIWSLVLPPNTLLGLKRLYVTDAASFRMPESLWARIVFDFLLAYRLRTINRGHLLGALIPLYLACVASHINITASGTDPERHIEAMAAAFEAEKPYLVSRWRWPDRFNP